MVIDTGISLHIVKSGTHPGGGERQKRSFKNGHAAQSVYYVRVMKGNCFEEDGEEEKQNNLILLRGPSACCNSGKH